MKRQVEPVTLRSGEVVYVLVQSCDKYFAMQDALEKIGADEALPKAERIKAGFTVKLQSCLSDADGVLQLSTMEAAAEYRKTLPITDCYAIIDQLNKNNGMDDASIEATEKK